MCCSISAYLWIAQDSFCYWLSVSFRYNRGNMFGWPLSFVSLLRCILKQDTWSILWTWQECVSYDCWIMFCACPLMSNSKLLFFLLTVSNHEKYWVPFWYFHSWTSLYFVHSPLTFPCPNYPSFWSPSFPNSPPCFHIENVWFSYFSGCQHF